ncbi:MAG: hypothetical protein AB9866_17650 [Syntrophobacteraceae bacterium]
MEPNNTIQMEKKMELKNMRQENESTVDQRETYESPRASFVPLKISERLMGCGFYSYCAPNSYYS